MSEPAPTNLHIDSSRCQKLKRAIIVGFVIALAVLGYHFYEHFQHKPMPAAPNDIIELTKQLYEEEIKHNPYLYKVNVQGKTSAGARDDRASRPLLELHEDLLAINGADTTISLMKKLHDNYELDAAIPEQVTAEETQEEHEFLRAIMNTRIMKLTMKFLVLKNLVASDYDAQMALLKELWFTQYSRGQRIIGSSGFEHVFMAEIKAQKVLGLHNWIYYASQEQQGHLDYKGYMQRVDLAKNDQMILALRSKFYNLPKPYNAIFIGTSPELELSLYTVCFLTTKNAPCNIELGHTKFSIITHEWDWHGKKLIASAYASIDENS